MTTQGGVVPVVATLRRLMQPPAAGAAAHRCDLCGAGVPEAHGHVVDTHTGRLLCACGICGGVEARAADARYRGVPSRVLRLSPMTMPDARWQALAIPVNLAFFVFRSRTGRVVGFYPGPAGATESELSLDGWSALEHDAPSLETIEPDVEALLVRRTAGGSDAYVAPIDVCYELVGRIRSRWTGMSGGDAVRRELEAFFERLLERSGAARAGARP